MRVTLGTKNLCDFRFQVPSGLQLKAQGHYLEMEHRKIRSSLSIANALMSSQLSTNSLNQFTIKD